MVKIQTYNLLPLKFELREIINNEIQEENLFSEHGNSTDEISFKADSSEEHEYMLIIKWNDEEKDYKYSEEIDYVQIIINCNQAEE